MLDPSIDGHCYQYSKTDAKRCINFIVIHNLYTLASNCLSHIIEEGRKTKCQHCVNNNIHILLPCPMSKNCH